MARVLKIKLLDAEGTPLARQSLWLTGCDMLISNDEGVAQFLLSDEARLTLMINDEEVWCGQASELSVEET